MCRVSESLAYRQVFATTRSGNAFLKADYFGLETHSLVIQVLLVADRTVTFELTGNGDVLEPQNGVMGVGSGGTFALAAALALMDQPHMTAEGVAKKAMKIAGDICVYTNHNVLIEVLEPLSAVDGTATTNSASPVVKPV